MKLFCKLLCFLVVIFSVKLFASGMDWLRFSNDEDKKEMKNGQFCYCLEKGGVYLGVIKIDEETSEPQCVAYHKNEDAEDEGDIVKEIVFKNRFSAAKSSYKGFEYLMSQLGGKSEISELDFLEYTDLLYLREAAEDVFIKRQWAKASEDDPCCTVHLFRSDDGIRVTVKESRIALFSELYKEEARKRKHSDHSEDDRDDEGSGHEMVEPPVSNDKKKHIAGYWWLLRRGAVADDSGSVIAPRNIYGDGWDAKLKLNRSSAEDKLKYAVKKCGIPNYLAIDDLGERLRKDGSGRRATAGSQYVKKSKTDRNDLVLIKWQAISKKNKEELDDFLVE